MRTPSVDVVASRSHGLPGAIEAYGATGNKKEVDHVNRHIALANNGHVGIHMCAFIGIPQRRMLAQLRRRN